MSRVTAAPLPKLGEIVAAVVRSPSSDVSLAAPWCRKGEEAFWFSRSSWSLAFLAGLRLQLAKQTSVSIWLPDYFCNSALTELRKTAVNLVFYPIKDDLTPDISECNVLAEQAGPDIFVVVHFFGNPVVLDEISLFCTSHRSWLIEDAAHVLQPIHGVGQTGDFVLYSPHKHLAIPNGAVLVARTNGPSQLIVNHEVLPALRSLYSRTCSVSHSFDKSVIIWSIKRILQRIGMRYSRTLINFFAEAELTTVIDNLPIMSSFSKRLLTRITPHLNLVANKRKQHAAEWNNVLKWSVLSVLPESLQCSATPYLACFNGEDEQKTAHLFDKLQDASLPVSTWPDLPPEVMYDSDKHSTALSLRNRKIFLPVHQTVTSKEILTSGLHVLNIEIKHWQIRPVGRVEWDSHLKNCCRVNLLQSWEYGDVKDEVEGWGVQRLVVFNENGRAIAMVQVLTKCLPFLGGIARVNRGPLTLNGEHEDDMKSMFAVLSVLMREAKRQRWWAIQIAPEIMHTDQAVLGLKALGLKKRRSVAWASAMLNLNMDEQTLLMHLNGKWRNCLRKGKKLGVVVDHRQCEGSELEFLLKNYQFLQNQKGFEGLSKVFISALAKQASSFFQFNLFFARDQATMLDAEPIGLLVTIRTGDTTLYLIGTTNERGRKMQANSVLLWESLLHAKRSGCHWFDVGGLSDATPKGIADFKKGLNANAYQLIGEWWKLNISPFRKI